MLPNQRPELYELIPTNPDIRCANFYTPIQIGYMVNNHFVSVLTTCFNHLVLTPVYTRHELTPWARRGNNGDPPDVFQSSAFYNGIDVNNLYATSTDIIHGLGFATYPIPNNPLNTGDLAPNADFLYQFQRDATFSYLNVAPQWTRFNSGNWERLENGIALLTQRRNNGVATVLTGTLNILTLTEGDFTESIYLLPGDQKLPVPEFFWKFVLYPTVAEQYVFFGSNIPDRAPNFIPTICAQDALQEAQTAWGLGGIDNTDPSLGIIYACRAAEVNHPVIRQIVDDVMAEFNLAPRKHWK
ncbi:uncharacterized protein LOC135138003 [Zophobas morio]|uniref:uncharacterized protein LOC135138003 n=1 Tax=Zophobas morio TaxID=2755281 RepID=UPI0030828CBA